MVLEQAFDFSRLMREPLWLLASGSHIPLLINGISRTDALDRLCSKEADFHVVRRCQGPFWRATGASLAELVIVLAGASVLAAMAVPNFNRFRQDWMLLGSAHLLASSLQWGRMHAIAANTSVVLEVDGNGRRFYWADPVNGEPYAGSIRNLPGAVQIVGSPRRPLRYFPRGNAAPAGTYILQGAAGSCQVIVSPGGRIRIRKG